MAEDIRDAILEYIKDEYVEEDDDDVELDYDTPLISGGIVDSFSMISLKVFLEKKYNIQIPDTKATPEMFDSVNKIAAVVRECTGE